MTHAILKTISKVLSLVLRHSPEKIGITLDTQGWTDVEMLLQRLNAAGHNVDRALLEEVVATNNKQRFAFNEDGTMIRANQGHSVSVDLGYSPSEPPPFLYHGTAVTNVASIRESGIHKGNRHHVHLSSNKETAVQVGGRHGKPVVLVVRAGEMYVQGFAFFQSENGVWLTDFVPATFIG